MCPQVIHQGREHPGIPAVRRIQVQVVRTDPLVVRVGVLRTGLVGRLSVLTVARAAAVAKAVPEVAAARVARVEPVVMELLAWSNFMVP